MDEERDSGHHSDASESAETDDGTPGSRKLWFGRHNGLRLDELYEGYKAWACHPDQKQFRWYDDFKQLCDEYQQWREANLPDKEVNPGNTHVWFGQYKHQDFRMLYNAPGYLRFLLQAKFKDHSWYYWVKDHAERYTTWLNEHPVPESRLGPRGPNSNLRDVGERVTSWDDRLPPQDEYELDGFVVPDDEFADEADTFDDDDYVEDERPQTLQEELDELRDDDELGDDGDFMEQDKGSDHESVPESVDKESDEPHKVDVPYDKPENQKARKKSALDDIKQKRGMRSTSVHSASSASTSALSPRKHAKELSSDEEEEVVRPSRIRRQGAQRKSLLDSDSDEEPPTKISAPQASTSAETGPRRSARLSGGKSAR